MLDEREIVEIIDELAADQARVRLGLGEILEDLKRFGHPMLFSKPEGWNCCIEMNTSQAGVRFDVNSEYGHATPRDAAQQCLDRCRSAIKSLTNNSASEELENALNR